MSNCIKDLYDCDSVKKCCVCEKTSLKSNSYKRKLKEMDIDLSLYVVVRKTIIKIEINY